MAKRATTDHGLIIHFAGRHHLFPVAQAADASKVRLASRDDLREGEVRVGWQVYFRPFIDERRVFLFDETSGEAVSRAEAEAQVAGAAKASAKEL
jgi:hypothetical protein